jgi:hypothetical protein
MTEKEQKMPLKIPEHWIRSRVDQMFLNESTRFRDTTSEASGTMFAIIGVPKPKDSD